MNRRLLLSTLAAIAMALGCSSVALAQSGDAPAADGDAPERVDRPDRGPRVDGDERRDERRRGPGRFRGPRNFDDDPDYDTNDWSDPRNSRRFWMGERDIDDVMSYFTARYNLDEAQQTELRPVLADLTTERNAYIQLNQEKIDGLRDRMRQMREQWRERGMDSDPETMREEFRQIRDEWRALRDNSPALPQDIVGEVERRLPADQVEEANEQRRERMREIREEFRERMRERFRQYREDNNIEPGGEGDRPRPRLRDRRGPGGPRDFDRDRDGRSRSSSGSRNGEPFDPDAERDGDGDRPSLRDRRNRGERDDGGDRPVPAPQPVDEWTKLAQQHADANELDPAKAEAARVLAQEMIARRDELRRQAQQRIGEIAEGETMSEQQKQLRAMYDERIENVKAEFQRRLEKIR